MDPHTQPFTVFCHWHSAQCGGHGQQDRRRLCGSHLGPSEWTSVWSLSFVSWPCCLSFPHPAAGACNRWAGMWVASWSHWGSPTESLSVGVAVEAGGCGSLWFIPVLESREKGPSVQGLLTFPETLTSEPSLYSIAWCAALLCPVCPPDRGHCSLYTLGLAPTPNAVAPGSSYMR